MKALIQHNTEPGNDNFPDIIAVGAGADNLDIVQAFSDALTAIPELHANWSVSTFHVKGDDGTSRDFLGRELTIAEVIEAFGKTGELKVDVVCRDALSDYSVSWNLRDIPEASRCILVKSGKSAAGTLETPSVVTSGTREACEEAMEGIREDSCEYFDGGQGHWEYLGSEGELVCYDIVEE